MKMSRFAIAAALAAGGAVASSASGQADPAPDPGADRLAAAFRQPAAAAKPRVWWHWMNGNVTRQGITADLEWFHRIGLAGFQLFDVDIGTRQYVAHRLKWMSPEWRDALRYAAREAGRLDLEMGIAGSPGWSQAGGPWVAASDAMKKLTWSSTRIAGGEPVTVKLAAPPWVDGPFLDMPYAGPVPLPGDSGAAPASADVPPPPHSGFYAGLRVVAIPAATTALPRPQITISAAGQDAALLGDGRYDRAIDLRFTPERAQHVVQFDYGAPVAISRMTMGALETGQMMHLTIPAGRLEASDDGTAWRAVLALPGAGHHVSNVGVRTYAFAPVTARFFRVVLDRPGVEPVRALAGLPPLDTVRLAELELGDEPAVDRWEGKGMFANLLDMDRSPMPATTGSPVAIDLTERMRPDGTLAWTAPPGQWDVLRIGMSLVGARNHPAAPEATGYEVDKLDGESVGRYFDAYLGKIRAATGGDFGKSLRVLVLDGIESGVQNATPRLLAEFRTRRGYDPVPYLPVLAGRVVVNGDVSERFLWDFRRTLADLLRDDYYAVAAHAAATRGFDLYAQAVGPQAPADADALEVKGLATVPMAEFWTAADGAAIGDPFAADLREAASAAHIYGKPVVAAESFTTYQGALPAWGQGPFYLKQFADQALALGVNRFVIHTSVHQPFVDDAHRPGLMLGPFGQNFTRNITWADQAKDWIDYLARTSSMMQQGAAVTDIAYFYGEGTPAFASFWKPLDPEIPEGYAYDFLNADRLMQARVDNGDLVLPGGARYRVLVLPTDARRLTLRLVRKLTELVEAGATVMAPPPLGSPSLSDYPRGDAEIASLVARFWGQIDGKSQLYNGVGKGRILWWGGPGVGKLLPALGYQPDVDYSRPRPDSRLVWAHRRDGDADIYFVANRNGFAQDVTTRFRVDGKAPELWDPATGAIAPADYVIADKRASVPLHLDPYGSIFVVFRRPATAPIRQTARAVPFELADISRDWSVSLDRAMGAPPEIKMPQLASLSLASDSGVKYYSGAMIYRRTLTVDPAWLTGARLMLDLGEVKDMANVTVNGRRIERTAWKPPFSVDITELVRPGNNTIEVKVTNMWTNRMIGDLQPGAKRHSFTNFEKLFTKDSPLLPSGLLGPVRLLRIAP